MEDPLIVRKDKRKAACVETEGIEQRKKTKKLKGDHQAMVCRTSLCYIYVNLGSKVLDFGFLAPLI